MQPNFEAAMLGASPFIVDSDASDFALGAVLSQVDEDGRERPVYIHSRQFSSAELNYATTEKEGLAVVSAMQKFRPYVLGCKTTNQRCFH